LRMSLHLFGTEEEDSTILCRMIRALSLWENDPVIVSGSKQKRHLGLKWRTKTAQRHRQLSCH
jgi:hypothetical protein